MTHHNPPDPPVHTHRPVRRSLDIPPQDDLGDGRPPIAQWAAKRRNTQQATNCGSGPILANSTETGTGTARAIASRIDNRIDNRGNAENAGPHVGPDHQGAEALQRLARRLGATACAGIAVLLAGVITLSEHEAGRVEPRPGESPTTSGKSGSAPRHTVTMAASPAPRSGTFPVSDAGRPGDPSDTIPVGTHGGPEARAGKVGARPVPRPTRSRGAAEPPTEPGTPSADPGHPQPGDPEPTHSPAPHPGSDGEDGRDEGHGDADGGGHGDQHERHGRRHGNHGGRPVHRTGPGRRHDQARGADGRRGGSEGHANDDSRQVDQRTGNHDHPGH